jgi:hypothetical protein
VRLLVLGARRLGLLASARARGLYVIAVDRDPAAPGFRLTHRRAILPLDDEVALERLVEAERVDGIVGTGPAVAVAARLAARFRLPHPLAPESALLVTSRLRQRVRLGDARVPQTRWAVVRGDALPGFPCVLGPVDRKGRRLAEEVSSAAEPAVTAFSRRGRFRPLLGNGPAAVLAQQAVEALGIRDGLTSTRLRLGPDGPRVVDVRTEVSDREAELCRLLLGIDVHGLALDAALGRAREPEYVRFRTADADAA